MNRIVTVLLLLAVPTVFASCFFTAPVIPPTGLVYSGFSAPMSLDLEADMGSRMGEAKSMSILGLVAVGDCSVKAAAMDAGIKTVKHLDYKYMNVLGIFQEFTTIAYGD